MSKWGPEMITVFHPNSHAAARGYAVRSLLQPVFSSEILCVPEQRLDWRITFSGSDTSINMPDVFFPAALANWRERVTISAQGSFDLCTDNGTMRLPIVLSGGSPEGLVSRSLNGNIRLDTDLPGLVFFAFSRYEELGGAAQDEHGRSCFAGSTVESLGLLRVPFIDYCRMLFTNLVASSGWGSALRKRKYKVELSCDVDFPLDPAFDSVPASARRILGDLVRRRNFSQGFRSLRLATSGVEKRVALDPFFSFPYLFEQAETRGLSLILFFLACGPNAHKLDGNYDIGELPANNLLGETLLRGHRIGLHGSYMSATLDGVLEGEMQSCLRSISHDPRPILDAVRFHYLRWDVLKTPSILAALGVTKDHTGGFAELPGFRFMTCHPFPVWDWLSEKATEVLTYPLIIMEQSLHASSYMGLPFGSSIALGIISELSSHCRAVGGQCSLLWHNSNLTTTAQRLAFEQTLEIIR